MTVTALGGLPVGAVAKDLRAAESWRVLWAENPRYNAKKEPFGRALRAPSRVCLGSVAQFLSPKPSGRLAPGAVHS